MVSNGELGKVPHVECGPGVLALDGVEHEGKMVEATDGAGEGAAGGVEVAAVVREGVVE